MDFSSPAATDRTLDAAPALQLPPRAAATAAALAAEAGASHVALQLPDALLASAPSLAHDVQRLSGIEDVVVLADTTFGSCCIDTVAAEHANADFVVHFGPSCLSRPSAPCPVLLVFDELPVDLAAATDFFLSTFGGDRDQPVLVLWDTPFHHAMPRLRAALDAAGFSRTVWPHVRTLFNMPAGADPAAVAMHAADPVGPDPDAAGSEAGDVAPVREAQGRRYCLPPGVALEDLSLFYVGGESLTLTNIMMTHSQCKLVAAFDPTTNAGRIETGRVNRLLMRRYVMVQKARDADVVGIVVGTLGLASYLPVIENLKRLVLASGKKPYMLAVGKPSPAKLGNFLEIDVFVLVACPQNALLESRDFLKPVITPHELQVALDRDAEWDASKYELDLVSIDRHLTKVIDRTLERNAERGRGGDDEDASDDDEPHFSLITGTYKQHRKFVTVVSSDGAGQPVPDGTVATRSLDSTVSRFVATSAAAEFLNEKRTFRGLEVRMGETSIADVQEGRRGIARGYVVGQSPSDTQEQGGPGSAKH
ncbi:Diphthamide biosynthesis protein 2 [Polyrhizophydium stewartii]|uniref:2-(3-amino-3-carboxypropyl)histidine synthase subunit 2 n=1 Tax=Polyrhizophydium stewartii TaxID=2732419 RepID=A0ABR4N2U5_9FUNG|nr:Diphthamide biosynthesis protein 2 [Polyrhizophydium stewartii]